MSKKPIVDPFPPGPHGNPLASAQKLDRPLTNKKAFGLALWTLAGFAVAAVVVLLLGSSSYVRYQQEAGTIQFHARWVYERIHFDPTPIDVAIIGTSRLEAGISPLEMQNKLDSELGRPVHVADLALLQMGRNLHYAIAKDLLNTHPEVKIIVLSVEEAAASAHPVFKYVADDVDVVRSPVFLNMNYFDDLFYLPIRHMTYFAETIAPGAFGIDRRFQQAKYLGTDLDRTLGYSQPDGTRVNGMRTEPESTLIKQAQTVHMNYASTLRMPNRIPKKFEYAVEYNFTNDIARLAAQHHVKLVFLHIPMFGNKYPVIDSQFYRHLGPYLDESWIADRQPLYFDGAHLNRAGAIESTDWVASQIAPLLAVHKSASAK
jgi:hypothetical protein